MKNKLEYLLKSVSTFEQTELNVILECFKPRLVKKNTLLLQVGETCKEFYYVDTGCLRTGFLDKNGDEKTRLVLTDCNVGTALTSFISGKPSIEFIEAVEDTVLFAISRSNFYRLNSEYRSWSYFYQRMLEMAYAFQNRRIAELFTLSAKQRYHQVLSEYPLFVQKLSNKALASYLGIREETLSRLKGS